MSRAVLVLALVALGILILAAPPTSLAAGLTDSAWQGEAAVQAQEDDGDPEANLPFLFAVFIITWALFFAYLVYMTVKRRAMEREIIALRGSIEGEEPDGPADSGHGDGAAPGRDVT